VGTGYIGSGSPPAESKGRAPVWESKQKPDIERQSAADICNTVQAVENIG